MTSPVGHHIVNKHCMLWWIWRVGDNLEVLAIVQIVKKRFLQAEEVFRSLTLSSRHLLAWIITMTPTQRLGPMMGSKESKWKWSIGRRELAGASAATVFRCLPMQSVRAVRRLPVSSTDEIRKPTHLRLGASPRTHLSPPSAWTWRCWTWLCCSCTTFEQKVWRDRLHPGQGWSCINYY